MKIIAGLGNPGKKYERTRHNAGFLVIDEFAREHGISLTQQKHEALIGKGAIGTESVVLAKPQTYMNLSGKSASGLLRNSNAALSDLVVVHDELDLLLGDVRVKIGGGHGGHNGLRSLIEDLGSVDFIRVRVGIGRPPENLDPADYVLSPFGADERPLAAEAISRAAEAVRAIIIEGPTAAMNRFNKK